MGEANELSKQVSIPAPLHEQLRVAAEERMFGISKLAELAIVDFLARLVPVDEVRLTKDTTTGLG